MTFKSFRTLLFILILTLCSGFRFSTGEYEEIRAINATLLSDFPAEMYFFVGIGRSPTPVISFLNAIGIKSAKQIPLSQMMSYPQMSRHRLETKDLMQAHLTEYLPNKQELNGKKVLLIDFAVRGESLVESTKVIREFYGNSVQVDSIALLDEAKPTAIKDFLKHNRIKILPINADSEFYKMLFLQRYDEFSSVGGKLVWNTWSKPEHPNLFKAKEFQDAMNARVENDPYAKKLTLKSWTKCVRALMPF